MGPSAPRFRAGDCFVITGYNAHLWLVLSDPSADCDNIVIVNITTLESYKDRTCVLSADDHPWIKHSSCVNFSASRITTNKHLTSLEAREKLLMEPPLSYQVYKDIFLKAAIESQQIPKPHSDFLYGQGIVPERDYQKRAGPLTGEPAP
jgi:hypothetical protein